MDKQETKDWVLTCILQWKRKRQPKLIECYTCNGHRQIGIGFGYITDPVECPDCFGTGKIGDPNDEPLEPMPPLSQDLIKHLKKAWDEYFNPPEKKSSIVYYPMGAERQLSTEVSYEK